MQTRNHNAVRKKSEHIRAFICIKINIFVNKNAIKI